MRDSEVDLTGLWRIRERLRERKATSECEASGFGSWRGTRDLNEGTDEEMTWRLRYPVGDAALNLKRNFQVKGIDLVSVACKAVFTGMQHRATCSEGPTLDLMLCCHYLAILNNFLTSWLPKEQHLDWGPSSACG